MKNRTNSLVVKNAIKKHILDSVMNKDGQNFETFTECKAYVLSEFNRVANYPSNLKNIPNNFDRFSDYLNRVPFSLEFYYSDIRRFLNTLKLYERNYELSDKSIGRLYHYLIWSTLN